jgi:hypothetical protein
MEEELAVTRADEGIMGSIRMWLLLCSLSKECSVHLIRSVACVSLVRHQDYRCEQVVRSD